MNKLNLLKSLRVDTLEIKPSLYLLTKKCDFSVVDISNDGDSASMKTKT